MAHDTPGLDDPLWDYVLETRLRPYIDYVRAWWLDIENVTVTATGIYSVDGPPGLSFRFTRTVKRSPIVGVQTFPFVPTGYLQITGIQGGSNKMVERVCKDGRFKIDEFTIIEKHNLPSTYQQGQFVAFVPTEIIEDPNRLGIWLYISHVELQQIALGIIPETLKVKACLKA